MYKTIAEIRAKNKEAGKYFFSRNSMRFFNSKIESGVLEGQYFITSERYEPEQPKMYTIRKALETGHIINMGEFRQFYTVEEAKDYINNKTEKGTIL